MMVTDVPHWPWPLIWSDSSCSGRTTLSPSCQMITNVNIWVYLNLISHHLSPLHLFHDAFPRAVIVYVSILWGTDVWRQSTTISSLRSLKTRKHLKTCWQTSGILLSEYWSQDIKGRIASVFRDRKATLHSKPSYLSTLMTLIVHIHAKYHTSIYLY